jgi:tetratricopeptide (TPR) repeat protein
MKDSRKPNTRVDLGDDLLQTRTLQRTDGDEAPTRLVLRADAVEESVDELLLNAKILVGEGLLEDAKRTLRKILKREPGNLTSRDRLEEIQKIEIKRLLGNEESPRSSLRRARKNAEAEIDSHAALTELEKEVGLRRDVESEFFKTPTERDDFMRMLDGLCQTASAQDRIDLGIGFLEMEFYDIAIRQFETAAKDIDLERKARGLLATALLEKGRPFDAMIELEALVSHQEAKPEEKLDYGYLAGKAQEALGHFPAAAHWYRAVYQIDPQYRDVADRLKFSLKKCASTPSSSS